MEINRNTPLESILDQVDDPHARAEIINEYYTMFCKVLGAMATSPAEMDANGDIILGDNIELGYN